MRKAIAITAALLTVLAITQAASAANDIPGTVKVEACTLGIVVDQTAMDFGSLFPGTSSLPVSRSLTVSGTIGGECKPTIDVSFMGTNWTGASPPNRMDSTQTQVIVAPGPPVGIPLVDTVYGPFGIGVYPMDFRVLIPIGQPADTYSQTVTVTGTY